MLLAAFVSSNILGESQPSSQSTEQHQLPAASFPDRTQKGPGPTQAGASQHVTKHTPLEVESRFKGHLKKACCEEEVQGSKDW